MTEFVDQFTEGLERGAEALEEAGYEVETYEARVEDRNGIEVAETGETPEDALDATLQEVQNEDQLFFYVSGDEFAEAIEEGEDVESLLYRNMRGALVIDEPMTDKIQGSEGVLEVEEPLRAFGIDVKYTPEFPDGIRIAD